MRPRPPGRSRRGRSGAPLAAPAVLAPAVLAPAVAAPVLVAALVAALLAAALVAAAPAAAPAYAGQARIAAPAEPVADDDPLTVTVGALSPVSATDGSTLTVRGTVHNTGVTAVTAPRLLLGTGTPPGSRATLLRDLDPPVGEQPAITRTLTTCTDCLPATLAPGASAAYGLSVPLGTRLDVGVVVVYPLIVRVLDATGELGQATTYLPYLPDPVSAPLHVGWLLPLDPSPVQAADGAIASTDFPAALSPGGALGGTLAAVAAAGSRAAPVTYAVEPSLLAAAAETAHAGWTRRGGGAAQGADAGSAAFLDTLARQTRGRDVLALPYGDPDAVALTRAGRGLDLSAALASGRQLVGAALPAATVLDGLAWAPGLVDQATLDTYAAAGTTAVVLPGEQVPALVTAFPPTPTALTALPTQTTTLTGLALDPDVQEELAAGGRDAPTARMSAQRLLALLAFVLGESPNSRQTRDVVLALPRATTPDDSWLRAVLTDTGSASWLAAGQLGDLLDTGTAGSTDREPLAAYPAAARAAELPAAALSTGPTSVATLDERLDAVTAALPDGRLTRPLHQALQRSESYAWRADPGGGEQLRAGVAGQSAAISGALTVASAGTVTLASSDATIPVTVGNALTVPATVMLALVSTDATRLSSTPTRVVVPARSSRRVLLGAATRRTGTFRAELTLTTPAGLPLAQHPVTVHSRAYGSASLVITFGALAVLLGAIAVRTTRRIRQAHRR